MNMKLPQSILLAIDDSMRHTAAIRRATEIARRAGAELHLCMVAYDLKVDAVSDHVDAGVERLARLAYIEPRRRWLAATAEELRAQGLEVDSEVVWSGRPDDVILAKALARAPDLVVKDLERETLVGEWAPVSHVDWQLIRQCPVPLMLVQKEGVLLPRRIAAAVDPAQCERSACCLDDRVVATALPLAMAFDARLELLHVCPFKVRTSAALLADRYASGLQAQDEALFAEFADRHGVADEQRRVLRGEPVREMSRHVVDEQVDLLVVGSEYRSGFGRFLHGSTAEALISQLRCDLLLVRPESFADDWSRHRDLTDLRATYAESVTL